MTRKLTEVMDVLHDAGWKTSLVMPSSQGTENWRIYGIRDDLRVDIVWERDPVTRVVTPKGNPIVRLRDSQHDIGDFGQAFPTQRHLMKFVGSFIGLERFLRVAQDDNAVIVSATRWGKR